MGEAFCLAPVAPWSRRYWRLRFFESAVRVPCDASLVVRRQDGYRELAQDVDTLAWMVIRLRIWALGGIREEL